MGPGAFRDSYGGELNPAAKTRSAFGCWMVWKDPIKRAFLFGGGEHGGVTFSGAVPAVPVKFGRDVTAYNTADLM